MYLIFIDLEKEYDGVPRDILWKSLEKKWVIIAYIPTIQDMTKGYRLGCRHKVERQTISSITIGLYQI